MTDYLEKLRMKPVHIRRRIATGTAAGFTALVALVWFGVSAASGTFSLAPAPTTGLAAADAANPSVPDVGTAFGAAKTNFTSLLGAASASFGNGDAPSPQSSAGITIQTEASTTVAAPEPTAIPF